MSLIDDFEKTETYRLCKCWMFDFDEKSQTYYCIDPRYISDVIAINAAWMMFQELNK